MTTITTFMQTNVFTFLCLGSVIGFLDVGLCNPMVVLKLSVRPDQTLRIIRNMGL